MPSEIRKMREAYGDTVIELATDDESIVFVSADCGAHERAFFKDEGQGRLIETGIAEANSAVIAAGMASEGYKPQLLNFAYLMGRMYNQISQSICVDSYPVNIAGYYAGVWGISGRSHNCINDLALMRSLPNMSVFAPADYWETRALVRHANSIDGPTYLRLSGVGTPTVFDAEPDFKAVRRLTEGTSATIFCHGTMVSEALEAVAEHNLDAAVVNVTQIKPLPVADIISEATRTGTVVVVEEHSRIGGLGEAIASALAAELGIRTEILAAPDMFAPSVLMEEPDVYGKYGISKHNIADAVNRLTQESHVD
jgi:transketolase